MSILILVLSSLFAAVLLAGLMILMQFKYANAFKAAGFVRNGPWATNFAVGSDQTSLKLKAMIAVVGLWALKSTETVYFTTTVDSDGHRINHQHRYRIEGGDLDARWWAITVYKDNQFIPNEQYRYSYSHTNLDKAADGSWVIALSADPSPGNWIPLGRSEGSLSLNLRLYNPGDAVYQKTATIALPRIIKEG
jgi:hypothetical protein